MRQLLLSTAVTLFLSGVVAYGQDEKGDAPRLPFHPFADAVAGDWLVLSATAEDKSLTFEWKIEKVEGDVVTLVERCGSDEPITRSFSKKEVPTIAAYTGNAECERPQEPVTTADEEREVGGRKFKCKKLHIPLHDWDLDLWISTEVRLGYVAAVFRVGDNPPISETTLVGFGNASKTEWGLTAAQFNAMPKNLKLTDCGKEVGLDIYAGDGWTPEVNGEGKYFGISWRQDGYMASLCLSSNKRWFDAKMNERKGIETEDDLKDYCETHLGKTSTLESKTKTEKGWYVIAKRKGSDDKEHSQLMYVMKLGGEPFLFTAELTQAAEGEGETIRLEEALKMAETIQVHRK